MVTTHEVMWLKLRDYLKENNSDILSVMDSIEEKSISDDEMEAELLKRFFDKVQNKVENKVQQKYADVIKKLSYKDLMSQCMGFGVYGMGERYFINLLEELLNKRYDRLHYTIEYYFQEKGYRTGYYPCVDFVIEHGVIKAKIRFSAFQKDMFDRNDLSIESMVEEVYSEFDVICEITCK